MPKTSRCIEVALCVTVTAGATASLMLHHASQMCPSGHVSSPAITPIIRVESSTPAALSGDVRAERRAMRAELRAIRSQLERTRGPRLAATWTPRSERQPAESEQLLGHVEYTTIQRGTLESLMQDREAPFRHGRVVPSFEEGKPNGFKLLAIRRGSLLQTLGFRNGDIMTAVNDRKLGTSAGAMETYGELAKSGPKLVRVSLIRQGAPMTKFIEIR